MVSNGPKWSMIGQNGRIWSQMVPYGPKLSHMVTNGTIWSQMVPYGPKLYHMATNGTIWSQMVNSCSTFFKWFQINQISIVVRSGS